MSYIPIALRRLVIERANHYCEYCQLPDDVSFYPHELDHIIAQKHGGRTEAENLVLACWRCNRHKGSDFGSFDPETGKFSFLFNPRTQVWLQHFKQEESQIIGLTTEGRVTTFLLQFNLLQRLRERKLLHLRIKERSPDEIE